MFKTCSDPDFNWVHCLCDSATWVVKEPGKPIGFFYSRLFDDALSPSGLGFAVDAFRIDEDGTLDDFYSDILWDYGAADELIAAYPNKFSCAVRCDGLNPYDIPTSWSQGKGERYRARDTVLAAVDMLTDEADEAGIDACPEFYRNDYISMYLKTQAHLGAFRVHGRKRAAGLGRDLLRRCGVVSQPADLFRRPPGPADASARARRPYGHLGPPRRGGHIRGGKRPVGEQFELGVRPMAISRGVNHRSPHPRVAKSRDSYPLGARLFQRFPSGKRFSIGSRHGGLPVRETPWCRPSGAGSIVGEAPIRHLPPGADLYG